MNKFYILSGLFILSFFSCNAQLGVGLRVGYGGSSTSQELVNGMKRTIGFDQTFGLMLNYNLDIHFSGGMEFNYMKLSEGLEYNESFYPNDISGKKSVVTTPKIGYLQIPIFGRVTFGEKKYKAFLTFGPYIGLGLNGSWTNGPSAKAKGNYVLFDSTFSKVKFDVGDFKRMDIGGIIGIGGQYQIGQNGTLFLEGRLQLGFLDFYNKQTPLQKAAFNSQLNGNGYLRPSASWRSANITIGYFHTFKLPKKKSSAAVKKAGKQKR